MIILKKLLKISIIITILLFISMNALAYDKVEEYDSTQDIIFSTIVYNTSNKPCTICSCNMSVYEPSPNENIIKYNIQLDNNGNGIYTYNFTGLLEYNKNIYPINVICNDTTYSGVDDRNGIKINLTMFDFTSVIIGIIGISALLLFGSFKVDEKLWDIKLTMFFGGLIFLVATLVTAFVIIQSAPDMSDFRLVFDGMLVAMMGIIITIIYLYAKHRIATTLDYNK